MFLFHTFSNTHKITDKFWNDLFKTDNKKDKDLQNKKEMQIYELHLN